MLETLFAKAQSGVREQSQKILRRLPAFSSGVWIVIAVFALVGGRLLWVKASRPAHRQAIADAFGSDRLFGVAQLSHDGNRLTYIGSTDKGYGVMLFDITTGREKVVYEAPHISWAGDEIYIQAWPWSPDDRLITYSAFDQLYICPANSGDQPKPQAVNIPGLSTLVWVNPEEFAYQAGGAIGYARKQSDGHWSTRRLPYEELPNAGGASCLTAVSADSIAWLMNGVICRVRLPDDMTGTTDPFNITPVAAAAQRDLEANIKAVTFSAPPASQPPTDHLVLWCDASTLQLSNQSPVVKLADLSPNKNDLVPNGIAPTFNEPGSPRTMNKRGTIHFSQNGSMTNAAGLKTISSLGLTNSMPRTFFVLMHRDAGSQMLLGMGDSSLDGGYFGLCDQNDGLYLPSRGFSGNRTAPTNGSWMIMEVVYDGKTETSYVNGHSRGTTAFPLNTTDKELELGLRTGVSAAGSDGDFAELLVYDQALSPAVRQQVENYLNLKWFGNTLLLPGNPVVWCEPPIPQLASFSYSRQNGQMLIKSVENTGSNTLWRFDPRSANLDNASRIVTARSISGEQWAGPKNCAYSSSDLPHHGVAVVDAFGGGTNRLFEPQDLNWYTITDNGDKMFYCGTISNEPASGIAQYDLVSGQLKATVPYANYPSPYAQAAVSYDFSLALPSGRVVTCTVFPPAHFNPHKKYPLLLGDTLFVVTVHGSGGRLWVPAISSCGAFVIFVERGDWWQLDNWKSDVLGVYKVLANDPCIDKQRVFLFGSSAEARPLDECLADTPGIWKGAIFLNCYPNIGVMKSSPFQSQPSILMSVGSMEYQDYQLKQLQTNSIKSGVMVKYIIHPGEGHHLCGNAAQLERTRAIMHFMFDE